MRPLFIQWHLGLGDAIICAPIVAKYAAEECYVSVPAYERNVASVKSFFAHFTNVEVVPVKDEAEMLKMAGIKKIGFRVLKLGYYGDLPRGEMSFDEWFYAQAEMDLSERDTYCPLKKAAEKYISDGNIGEYVFLHDDEARGFRIKKRHVTKNKAIIQPFLTNTILQHADAIKHASEIHVIDSSFLHLCDALDTTGKLVWHQYARPYQNPENNLKLRKQWQTIK